MIRTDKRMRLCTALLGLMLCFIWGNSLMPAEQSQAFSDWVKEILMRLFSGGEGEVNQGSGLLRKIAHFTEFAALGACLGWRAGMQKRKQIWSVLFGFAAACVDEAIQCFVPDRGPGLRDVAIDTCGVIVGIGLLLLGHHLVRKFVLKENTQ